MKIQNFFIEHKIDLNNKKLLVAVSGGPDSMALLDMLEEMRQHNNFYLEVAHLDHQLREDSYRESEVLQKYCNNKNILLFEDSWPKKLHPTHGIEAAAREYRYEFLTKVAQRTHADYLLTAHHGDDLLENILLKLLRSGNPEEMNSLQEVGIMHGVPLLRPLLSFSKEELESYVKTKCIPYVVDKTNLEDDTVRNRLRHYVVPRLKEESPDLLINSLRFSREMTTLEVNNQKFLNSLARPKEVLGLGFYIDLEKLPSDELKNYLENFIFEKWHRRIKINVQRLLKDKKVSKEHVNLQIYQKRLWIFDNPLNSQPVKKLILEKPFVFQNRTYLLSKKKLNFRLITELNSPELDLKYGSIHLGATLLLNNGQHAKSKKKFAQAKIPLALRPCCLTIYRQDKPIFIENTYLAPKSDSDDNKLFLFRLS